MVSGLTFTSLMHGELIFVYGAKYWSSFILLCMIIQFPQQNLLKRQRSLFCFIDICLFLCQYHTVWITRAL